MTKKIFLGFSALFLFLSSCVNKQSTSTGEKNKIVLHFEIDSSGNLLNKDVEEQLKKLAKEVSKNADKIMITAYSEQTGSEEGNYNVSIQMARAAKDAMLKGDVTRIFYNVGIDAKGYQNPINKNNPADPVNRRVEITYL